jgi:hypothetical protein
MQFQFKRLQHRRATIDGGEEYDAYFCASSRPSVVVMRVVKRKSSLVILPHLDKGIHNFLS